MLFSRRQFLLATLGISFYRFGRKPGKIITVLGEIPAGVLGKTLVHEHILVDFIGADKISYDRWNRDQVEQKVLPYLLEAKQAGIKSIFDCTPAFLGRDVILLKRLSEKTGLHMITNTGYYGAVNNKSHFAGLHSFTYRNHYLVDNYIPTCYSPADNFSLPRSA